MIDEVMVWDVALEDHDITALRRTIIDNCTTYSGAGVGAATLETSFTIPADLTNHAWNIYVYGQREGEVNGAFSLSVDGVDTTGALLSTNTSNAKTFTTSWTSQTMRMRPAAQATDLNIKVLLDIGPPPPLVHSTSTLSFYEPSDPTWIGSTVPSQTPLSPRADVRSTGAQLRPIPHR